MRDENAYVKVTRVLGPFSGLGKIPAHILDNAARRGTRVHLACDALVLPRSPGYISENPDDDGYVMSFMKWYENKKFIPKPPRFFCDDLMLTGECDMIYEDERGLVLVDLKTPATESKTWPLQGSAYSYLAKKAGYDIKAIEFIRLMKTGGAPKVYNYTENFELFKSYLYIYRTHFEKENQENYLDYL